MKYKNYRIEELIPILLRKGKEGEFWDFKQEWHERIEDLIKGFLTINVTKANGYTKNGLNSYSLERGTVWNHGNASNYHRYWLASPGDGQSIDVWILDGYQARLVKDNCFNTYGFRPVVCLKSGVNLTTEGAGIYGTTYVLTK